MWEDPSDLPDGPMGRPNSDAVSGDRRCEREEPVSIAGPEKGVVNGHPESRLFGAIYIDTPSCGGSE